LPAMFFRPQLIIHGSFAGKTYYDADENAASRFIAESQSQYRPRHPERSAFYQLFETHFDGYVRAYEERFEPRSGSLRPVVVRSVEEFLSCGRLEEGFARIRCDKCRKSIPCSFALLNAMQINVFMRRRVRYKGVCGIASIIET